MQKIVRVILIVLLLINIIYVVVGVFHYPLNNVDVYGIWFLKAKAIYISSGFPLDFLKDKTYLYSHPQYPLLFPSFLALIYSIVGGVKEIYPLLFSPLVYILILIVAYKVLRFLRLSDLTALTFTYIYSMFSPLLAEGGRRLAGTVDIYLTLIYWIIIYIVLSKKLNKGKWGWVVVFLVVLASQVKFEGVFISVLLLFLPVKLKRRLVWFVVSVMPSVVWLGVTRYFNIPSDIYLQLFGVTDIFQRLVSVFIGVIKEMLNYRNWYIFWPLFFILVLTQRHKELGIRRIVVPTLTVVLLLFVAIYTFSNIDPYSYVLSSLDRIFLQLSPFWYLVFVDKIRRILTRPLINWQYIIGGGDK